MVRRICTESDGDGDGARANGERQCKRVKGAAENVGGIHIFLNLPALVGIFLFEDGPAVRDDDEAATDLHDGNGDAEEGEDVRADKIGSDDENKTVKGHAPGEKAAGGGGVVRSEGQEDGAAADRIDDGEEGADDEKDAFCDFEQEFLREKSIADTRMYLLEGVQPGWLLQGEKRPPVVSG